MRTLAVEAVPALTTDQMRDVDRIMVEDLHIELNQMMENAGRGLADLAMRRFAPDSVVVLAGPRGNGGGGPVTARHLPNRGAAVSVVASSADHEMTPVTACQLDIVVSFTVDGVPAALVAARLSAEQAIGVRHDCFCAHPYLIRLLGLSSEAVQRYRDDVLAGDRCSIPGVVRVSGCLSTTAADVQRLAGALAAVTSGDPPPVPYEQDVATGDFHPVGGLPGAGGGSTVGAGCSLG